MAARIVLVVSLASVAFASVINKDLEHANQKRRENFDKNYNAYAGYDSAWTYSNDDDDDDFSQNVSKRTKRFFVGGFGPSITENKLEKYIRKRGPKVSRIVLNKTRYGNVIIRVNVEDDDNASYMTDDPCFWPSDVTCRPWVSYGTYRRRNHSDDDTSRARGRWQTGDRQIGYRNERDARTNSGFKTEQSNTDTRFVNWTTVKPRYIENYKASIEGSKVLINLSSKRPREEEDINVYYREIVTEINAVTKNFLEVDYPNVNVSAERKGDAIFEAGAGGSVFLRPGAGGTVYIDKTDLRKFIEKVKSLPPIWTRRSEHDTLGTFLSGQYFDVDVEAVDPDGGNIMYSLISGHLPPGTSLNMTTGHVIGVAPDIDATYTFGIRATDIHGKYADGVFSISIRDSHMRTATIDYTL
ncbi:hypothetical protein MAR_012943 [Mya arenaria]|uniref:Uncharacterized protein n=1 Tax=Mya arenaria TaxID=6604 RepID=A0ABY7G169_MYAAR|nr:hypothetical protein MAR_012943 [Mya arenaria]